jgi:hypothetical protein
MLRQVLLEIFRDYRRAKDGQPVEVAPTIQPTSQPIPSVGGLEPCWLVFGGSSDLGKPFDVAVVMPCIGRATTLDAVRSVFSQDQGLRVQLLIGVDAPLGDFHGIVELLASAPPHVTACLFYPGYSTSARHGGLYPARDGGALRSILTYLANARYVSYLDDDNAWTPVHLKSLLAAVQGKDWAFSRRWFIHPETRVAVCEDTWESVGPGRGVFVAKFGGWVDPNCLLFDKMSCEEAIRWWTIPLHGDAKAMSADRHVYHFLQQKSAPGETREPTVLYAMQPDDVIHQERLQIMGDLYQQAGGKS